MPPIRQGVETFWDNADFQKGFGQFMQGIAAASKATGDANGPAKGLGDSLGGLAGIGGMSSLALIGLGAAAVAVGEFMVKLGEKVLDLIKDFADFIANSIQSAARLEELAIAVQFMGQSAGYSRQQIDDQTKAIAAMGLGTQAALNAQIQFARYGLDMAKATDLARIALDASVISGQSASDTLNSLIRGISMGSERALKFAGITIDMKAEEQKLAAALGTTTDKLTEQQKQQAMLNGVLAAGARIQGLHAAAEGTAAVQAQELGVTLKGISNTIGSFFLPAYATLIKTARILADAFKAAISEGGSLYPILSTLGAIASIVTDGIKGLAESISTFLTGAANDASNKVSGIATDALTWGANIAINLATGLIQGAASALTAALRWISNLLTSWLKPGSPPKIIPNIDKYGAAAMTLYMEGMTKADFSALNTIQSQMKSVFSQLVNEGKMASDDTGKVFAGLSKRLIKAISTGNVNEKLFQDIAKAGGEYGAELADLARKQVALAQAEDTVKSAEQALTDARKKEFDAGAAVNAETIKYNQMLRGGASAKELAAQKAKIDAAQKAKDAAHDEATQAQKNLDAANANVDTLKEQADLQAQILQNLLELAQAQNKPPETPGTGGGVPETPGLPPDLGNVDLSNLQTKFAEAVDNIKKMILEKLKDVWNELVAIWKEKMGPVLAQLKAAWDQLMVALKPVLDFLKTEWNRFWKWLGGEVQYWLDFIKGWWQRHGENVIYIVNRFIGWIGDRIQAGLKFVSMLWRRYGKDIEKLAGDAWAMVRTIITNALENIGLFIDLFAAILKGDWSAAWTAVQGIAKNVWENIKAILKVAWDIIKLAFKVLLDYLTWYWTTVWNGIKAVAEAIWNGIVAAAQAIWAAITSAITTAVDAVSTWLAGAWATIQNVASTIWQAISDAVSGIVTGFVGIVQGIIQGMSNWITTAWTNIQNTANTIWTGIKDLIMSIVQALFDWLGLDFNQQQAWFQKTLDDLYLIFSTIWTRIKSWVTTKVTEIKDWIMTAFTDVKEFLDGAWTSISDTATTAWNAISSTATTVWNTIKGYIQEPVQEVWDWLTTTWDSIKTTATTSWNDLKNAAMGAWAEITGWIKTAVTDVQGWLSDRWGEVKDTATTLWNGISTAISGIASGIVEAVEGVINGLVGPGGTLSSFGSKMVAAGKDLIQGLINGVGQMAGALVKAVEGLVNDAIDAIKRSLGIASPSKLTMGIGINMVKGLQQGINVTADLPEIAMQRMVDRMIPASAPVPVVGGPMYNSVNMNFNNNLNSQMDVYALQSLIVSTVKQALRR